MELMDRHNIKNLKGVLMYKDTPLVDFHIENYRDMYIRELNRSANYKDYPVEFLFDDAVTYGDINDFFKEHVVQDGAQDIMRYLRALGLSSYNLDEIVKRKNGYNHLSFYWLKMDGIGASSWNEILTQDYPIYE